MTTAALWKAPDLPIQIGPQPRHEAQRLWSFGLATPDFGLFTSGLSQRLPAGPAGTLGARTRRFFAAMPEDAGPEPSPRVLVGAIPFDREADDCLFLPEHASNRPWASAAVEVPGSYVLTAEPDRAAYEDAVRQALEKIRTSSADRPLGKIVLSRSLRLVSSQSIDPFALWHALKADPTAARFLVPLGEGADGAMRRLVGASPELLVSRRGNRVLSHPLAGSARRSADIAQDEAAAQTLLRSEKDRREHRVVVEAILDALAPYCSDLRAPAAPALVSTRTMWHLGTHVEGRLRHAENVSAAELAAALHPTPAVAGSPRDRATELIHELEGYDRGFYAGAVGWTNASGDGAWYVALRCAEVSGSRARLYAGAGIVEGSDPAAEADETEGKFQAVLSALGAAESSR